MNPSTIDATDERRPMSSEEVREMIRIANANGWYEEAPASNLRRLLARKKLTPDPPEK